LALIILKKLLNHAAEEMQKMIMVLISEKNLNYSKQVKLIYGGSSTPENSNVLFSMENIDEGLVGRCSIDLQSFIKLCHVADKLNCGEKA
tara:strand:+ start:346 stop:615 length:270 start_codon:yes stop_codon:yes gene_type:complete